jgi:hypothetical protein
MLAETELSETHLGRMVCALTHIEYMTMYIVFIQYMVYHCLPCGMLVATVHEPLAWPVDRVCCLKILLSVTKRLSLEN